ncbi:MAG: alpha/beta hydrolase [Proteobacteria bacterium]|nr:alpha/beta hydrolase [Pseudomonadota bacterium]
MTWFAGFELTQIDVHGITLNARIGGPPDAPPLLLLHGFPQTHVIWQRIAQRLKARFRLVMPDLRGYGDSSRPPGEADHANYSKRTMAADMAALMTALGHARFGLVGHDRGGRVAHRLALDHADRLTKLCVIDIAPTLDMYEATDLRFATAYYHWFMLIQPAPLPEKLIGGDHRFFLHGALGGWGAKGLAYIEPEALAEYERCFGRPDALHAACEDYRASAGIDLEHDRASRAAGQQIACDLLALWGERGVVHRLFDPVGLWRAQCSGTVEAGPMPAGHFIPEELPEETADRLLAFFS